MGQPVVHFEIGCQDKTRAADFCSELFGWQTQPAGSATPIDTGSGDGINGHFTALGHEPSRCVLVYIQVEDLTPHLERGQALGGGSSFPLSSCRMAAASPG